MNKLKDSTLFSVSSVEEITEFWNVQLLVNF